MREALVRVGREYEIDAVQVEYTALASYCGDILVEHDVTFSLYNQVHRRRGRCRLGGECIPVASI